MAERLSAWRDRERPTDRAPGEKALATQRRVVRTPPEMVTRVNRAIACVVGNPTVILLGLLPLAVGQAEAQQLRAALLHGEAVEAPVLFYEPTTLASCLWLATYNLYTWKDSTVSSSGGPAITLSFFTAVDWEKYVEDSSGARQEPTVDVARFHTRVLLTPLDGSPPPTQSRKAYGDGPFAPRHYLHPLGELVLAHHGIPTRLDSAGRATTNSAMADEFEALPGWLRACL